MRLEDFVVYFLDEIQHLEGWTVRDVDRNTHYSGSRDKVKIRLDSRDGLFTDIVFSFEDFGSVSAEVQVNQANGPVQFPPVPVRKVKAFIAVHSTYSGLTVSMSDERTVVKAGSLKPVANATLENFSKLAKAVRRIHTLVSNDADLVELFGKEVKENV